MKILLEIRFLFSLDGECFRCIAVIEIPRRTRVRCADSLETAMYEDFYNVTIDFD